MAKEHTYQDALLIELKFEGGKDDDPVDPGGRTNQGIIQREFSAWLHRRGQPNRDVFTMTDIERDAIYWENYGQKIRFDDLPAGIDLVILDGAINSGVSQSIKWAQRALGITADGVVGTVTIQRIVEHPDHDLLIAAICDRRMAFLKSLKTFYHFGHGWSARVEQLRKTGQAWATGANETPHFFVGNMNKKARIIDAEPLLSTAPADATAAGGTVAAALTGIQTVLQPLQGHSPVVDQVLLALVVLGGAATAFGMAYSWWVRQRNATLTDSLDLVPVKPPNDNLFVPQSVLSQYVDPRATGSSTGNIAPGVVTASGRQSGDTETRVNEPAPIPASKVSVDSAA